MTKSEFATFAMALKTYYPRENLLPNDQSMTLWFKQLEDIPYQVAEAGLQKWVSLNKWSPSIADIREMATSVSNGEMPDWGDAWEQVCKAIRKFGSYNVEDALNSLSPLARTVTERIGFRNLCMSENPQADRANFRMIYEQLAERKKKDAQLPLPLKTLIAKMQNETKMIESKEEDNVDQRSIHE